VLTALANRGPKKKRRGQLETVSIRTARLSRHILTSRKRGTRGETKGGTRKQRRIGQKKDGVQRVSFLWGG